MNNNIPYEIVDIIISYVDYKKYHKKKFTFVINDIKSLKNIFVLEKNNLPASIVYACWGNGWKKYLNRLNY